jgi:hypothetical protein
MRSRCCLSLCIRLYLSVSVHLSVYPLNFWATEAYEITFLSSYVYLALTFVRRLMRSPCCAPPLFFVFYAVRVVLKESRRSVLPRTC